ncbi:MAG: hypothetical protein Kow0098_07960 [Ignavibacteriaceae bacterium]
MKSIIIKFFLCLLFSQIYLYSQSNINPKISAIGTFNTFTNFIKDTPEYGKLNFETPELEMFIDGYLNPYSLATANFAFEEGAFALEELYAEVVRGLPLDIQLKAGKYLLGFGKLNTVHPHAWAFIERPLMNQVFLGEEGFNDIGFNISFILPLEEVYTTFDIGVYKGDAIGNTISGHHHGEEGEPEVENTRGINPMVIGRLSSFFSLSDFSHLETGINGAYGVLAKENVVKTISPAVNTSEETLYFLYGDFDFKYKYKPDSYTSLTVQGEGLLNLRDVPVTGETEQGEIITSLRSITTFGAFIYFDYQFLKQFSVGAKYDFTYGIIGDEPEYNTLGNDDENKTHGISGWVGFYPVEETLALRLGIQHLIFEYANDIKRDPETTLTLQLLFSLGPHKAHQF